MDDMFEVDVIKVLEIINSKGALDLVNNCMHIKGEYWFVKGDLGLLGLDICEWGPNTLDFEVSGHGSVPSLGGLSQDELAEIAKERCGVEIS